MTRLGQMLVNDGVKQGMAQGIRALVVTCKELGVVKCDVTDKVMRQFGVSKEEAEKSIEKYWE